MLLSALALGVVVVSDDPTWSRDVAPIVHRHCAGCHRQGEVAPFPLLAFEDARDHAEQIAEATRIRFMPPWLAEPNDPPHIGARRLTDGEIATLARWAELGAPPGDLTSAPPPPAFTPGWQLGPPDLVLTMPTPFVVPADGVDLYRNFVIPVPVTELKYVRAIELRPGNARVVHHAVIKLDKSDSSRRLDAKDPEPGFPEMDGGEAVSPDGNFLGWTPGRTPKPLSEGMAWRLPPDSDLVVQLHLLPSGKPEPVQATIGLFFSPTPPVRLPFIVRLGTQSLDIPAGESRYEVVDQFTLPIAADLTAVAPHAHFLGKTIGAWATLPDGTQRTLVDIRDWNFSWQDEFRFERPLALPVGTVLSIRWIFDNSDQNPRNPRRPAQRVVYGPSSLQEMCDVWFQLVPNGRADFETLQAAFERKDLALIRAGWEMKLAREPDDGDAAYHLGVALLQQGEAGAARARLDRAAVMLPNDARVLYHAGVAAERMGDLPAALGWYRQATSAEPTLVIAHLGAARLLHRRSDDVAAISEFEAALALEPTATTRKVLAWLRATSPVEEARDGTKAMESARALVAEPGGANDPEAFDALAAAQAELGRYAAAVKSARRAADLARAAGTEPLAQAIEQRLKEYAAGRAWREPQR